LSPPLSAYWSFAGSYTDLFNFITDGSNVYATADCLGNISTFLIAVSLQDRSLVLTDDVDALIAIKGLAAP
jgi:hypothetical protein